MNRVLIVACLILSFIIITLFSLFTSSEKIKPVVISKNQNILLNSEYIKSSHQLDVGSNDVLLDNSSINFKPNNLSVKTSKTTLGVRDFNYNKVSPTVNYQENYPVGKKSITTLKQYQKPSMSDKVKYSETQNKSYDEYEDSVVWNKWRSDIDNYIHNEMINHNSRLPWGTKYRYDFSVDKYNRISNIRVRIIETQDLENAKLGRSDFIKTIRALDRKDILKFPNGTARTSVECGSNVIIGDVDTFNTPDNYSDIEKVKVRKF